MTSNQINADINLPLVEAEMADDADDLTDARDYPPLEDFTKATGRMQRINSETGLPEPDPETGEKTVPKLTLSPSKAANTITDYMPLRISATDTKDTPKLWSYDGQIWKPDGEKQVINLIDSVIGDLSYERGLKETMRRVRARTDVVTFDGDPLMFPALDKVIDLRTGEARDYLPDNYVSFQYDVAFDNPNADYRPVL